MYHIDTNELQTIGSDIDETSSAQQFYSNSTFLYRPHNRLHICWSDAANGGGRYFSGHITGLFDQQKFKIFSWILLGDTCF